MGLTKQYLRYVPGPVFGLVGSNASICHVRLKEEDDFRCVAVSACEHVFIWNLRTGEKVLALLGEKSVVTCLVRSPNEKFLAVGYADGCVRIFKLENAECVVMFNGHKSAVITINYNEDGDRLVTGSKDTEIVIWDVINESGIVRLRGHKGPVTRCRFMKNRNVVVSSSKDTYIKFWDLDIQHCFYTLTGHSSEVWDFLLIKNESLLVSGGNDNELRIWKIRFKNDETAVAQIFQSGDIENVLSCDPCGTLWRDSNGRLVSLSIDPLEKFVACHGTGKILDLFKINSKEEIENKIHRRVKKVRKRLKSQPESANAEAMETDVSVVQIEDEIKKLGLIKASAKQIKAFDIISRKDGNVTVFLLLNNNSVETFVINSQNKSWEPEERKQLYIPGHRSDVRAVCFSSDDFAVLSGSSESIKVWNRTHQNCIRTLSCEKVSCLSFVPGDRHCVVGTKAGYLCLFDISSGNLLKSEDAHDGEISSLGFTSDQRSFYTGSADKMIKFWDLDFITNPETTKTQLTFNFARTSEEMIDNILCVKMCHDSRLIAASFLNNNIDVFFVDTLKKFLILHSHSLPVRCMDISSDNTLLVSGSDDKTVKIWGLDFGNVHRTLVAHDDRVTSVQFIPKTHLIFSAGNDGVINQWDADNFNRIITLKGHHDGIRSMGVSSNGKYIVSASKDKSLRLWEKTQEPLVLEEEQEREREEKEEQLMASGENTAVIPGETNEEAVLAGRKTMETIKAIEKLMEGMDIYDEEVKKLMEYEELCKAAKKEFPAPQPHPLMVALNSPTPVHFFMETLKKIKSSELEEALLSLPFGYVLRLLKLLAVLLDKDWEIELVCRCVFFLIRTHHGQITSNDTLSVIERLKEKADEKISNLKDLVNFNLAGLRFLKQELEDKEQITLFEDASKKFAEKRKRKKKLEVANKRAILTLP